MTNDRVTIAKLGQKLDDYKEYNDKQNGEIKSDIKEIKNSVNDITNILTKGDGKIKRNFALIDWHIKNHWKWVGIVLTLFTLVVMIVGIVITYTVG